MRGALRGVRLAALALVASLTACEADERAWDPDAALAVARRTREAAGEACLVVVRAVGPSLGRDMPFGVYQSLVTGGFLVEPIVVNPDASVAVLAFHETEVEGPERILVTSLTRLTPGPPAMLRTDQLRWRALCADGACSVVDSVHVGSEERAPLLGPVRPQGCPP